MVTPGVRRARVIMSAERDPGALLHALGEIDADPAQWSVVKHDERSSVFAGEVLVNQAVVVKCQRVDRLKDRFAAVVGLTRLRRQMVGAKRLSAAGLLCAEPRLLVRGQDDRGRAVETLMMDRLPGRNLLAELAEGPHDTPRLRTLALECGLLTRRLAQAGLFNRDHKPSNLVVLPEPFRPPLALVDTVGIQRRRPIDAIERMLANLVFELVGTGLVPRRTMMARAIYAAIGSRDRARFRSIWRGIMRRVRDNDDLVPRDPIATEM